MVIDPQNQVFPVRFLFSTLGCSSTHYVLLMWIFIHRVHAVQCKDVCINSTWSWFMHFLHAWDCCKNWAHVQYEEMLQNTEKDENYLRSVVFMTGSKLSRHGLCNICRDSMRKELVAVCTMQTSWIATPYLSMLCNFNCSKLWLPAIHASFLVMHLIVTFSLVLSTSLNISKFV